MIAVVKVGGHQAIVTPSESIEVDHINAEVGTKIELQVLLTSGEDGSNCQIGTPFLDQKIKATITEHGKGDKIKVFKMKPRKRYRRTQGHRQAFSVIQLENFGTAKAAPKKATKAESEKPAAKKEATKKADAPAKKAPAKKPAAKKPVAKKAEKK